MDLLGLAGILCMKLHCVTSTLYMFFIPLLFCYRKVPKFSDARKLCCKLPKIQEKRPKFWVFHQKDAIGITNSEDPDQTAPLGAV